jgi:glycosyltransferase involved in cell wall biosynthesis
MTPTLQQQFDAQKACVLMPTYNNSSIIATVIEDVLQYTYNIIVVNDGSTDNTLTIIAPFMDTYPIELVSYSLNKGKGNALLMGFKKAFELGYKYAITIDSDGQHYAKDLEKFLNYIEENPESLIIGARNMNQSHIPDKSTFGNKFSNFWFWVETGKKLPDTQSGYRLYPLQTILSIQYYSTKYEFEIEAPVRASWRGTPIANVPVSVFYPKEEDRISHFRPFKDFTRISILNTFLTLIALLWIHPRDFIKKIWSKEGRKQLWKESFVKPDESNFQKAISLSFGVFMGIIPIWGFQLAVGIPLSILFKMNKPLFILGANISIFPITPFIWLFSLMTGKWVLGFDDWAYDFKNLMSLEQFREAGLAFFLGGSVLALATSIVTFFIAYFFFVRTRKGV